LKKILREFFKNFNQKFQLNLIKIFSMKKKMEQEQQTSNKILTNVWKFKNESKKQKLEKKIMPKISSKFNKMIGNIPRKYSVLLIFYYLDSFKYCPISFNIKKQKNQIYPIYSKQNLYGQMMLFYYFISQGNDIQRVRITHTGLMITYVFKGNSKIKQLKKQDFNDVHFQFK
jgi:hypothetical protein